MSTKSNLLQAKADDPREIELATSLAEKTKQGKITWVKQRNAITATVPGGLELNFVTQQNLLGNPFWQLFTVRDARGNELLRANPIGAVLAFSKSAGKTLPSDISPLLAAVNELFEAVSKSADDDLEKAIHSVKNL